MSQRLQEMDAHTCIFLGLGEKKYKDFISILFVFVRIFDTAIVLYYFIGVYIFTTQLTDMKFLEGPKWPDLHQE